MKTLSSLAIACLLIFTATAALAERGAPRGERDCFVAQGAWVDRHLDRKGDLIEQRFERKALRAESQEKYRKAERFRTRGEHINRHLDRQGDRIRARHQSHKQHYASNQRHSRPGDRFWR